MCKKTYKVGTALLFAFHVPLSLSCSAEHGTTDNLKLLLCCTTASTGQAVVRDLLQLLRGELVRQLGLARQDCVETFQRTRIMATSGDGTWGQTANARFCTTSLVSLGNRCLIAVVHLTHDPRLHASNGFMIKVACSSKGMEPIGLETCARILKADGLQVTHWVLDGDTSVHNCLVTVHPGSQVCPCCNHYFKNVGKHLRKRANRHIAYAQEEAKRG
jgi:hypothetical protein